MAQWFWPSVGQGTADADQAPAIGQFPIFQHYDGPNLDVTDFAVFSEIVDVCTDNAPAVQLRTDYL